MIKFIFILRTTILPLYVLCTLQLLACTEVFSEPNFELTNDVFTSTNKDRFLTNRIGYGLKDFGMWSDMYTPEDKSKTELEEGDHPYSGYTYLSYQTEIPVDVQETRYFETRIGLLGPNSRAEELQKFVHNDLGLGENPLGWATQDASEYAIDIIYTHEAVYSLQSYLGDTLGVQKYGCRVGNVVDSVFFDQEITKKFSILRLISGVNVQIKAFDTHLEGRMFNSSVNAFTVKREPLVATARIGAEIEYLDNAIGFLYSYQTPTFDEQEGNHFYGSFYFRGDF